MADNTKQFEYMTTIKGGVEAQYRDDPNVFVAGNLLWYPVEGNPNIRIAPDVMIAFGLPKGHRGSYLQWEEGGIPPQVAFVTLVQQMAKERERAERLAAQLRSLGINPEA